MASSAIDYSTFKSKGLVTTAKSKGETGRVVITTTSYDMFGNTSASSVTLNISELQANVTSLTAQLAAAQTLLADAQAAK